MKEKLGYAVDGIREAIGHPCNAILVLPDTKALLVWARVVRGLNLPMIDDPDTMCQRADAMLEE